MEILQAVAEKLNSILLIGCRFRPWKDCHRISLSHSSGLSKERQRVILPSLDI